jgi:hypothetical protein
MERKVRDEYREDYDVGRGGWGHLKQKQEERQRQMRQDAMYRDDHDGGGHREVPDGAGEGVRFHLVFLAKLFFLTRRALRGLSFLVGLLLSRGLGFEKTSRRKMQIEDLYSPVRRGGLTWLFCSPCWWFSSIVSKTKTKKNCEKPWEGTSIASIVSGVPSTFNIL